LKGMDSEDNRPRHAPWMQSRAENRSPKKCAMWQNHAGPKTIGDQTPARLAHSQQEGNAQCSCNSSSTVDDELLNAGQPFMTTPARLRSGDPPREICATAVARWAKARARPPAGTCPEGHDVEIVFQDKSRGFIHAAESAFQGTGLTHPRQLTTKPLYGGVLNAPVFKTLAGKPFMTTPARPHRLSKSRFVAGCQCHKLLW
jgi:hypothetical protein